MTDELRIRVLPDHLVNLIAAGEVIERPASVVRELVENSVDAGALNVAVHVEEGGQNMIRVTDDGCGMSPEEAALAFRRHATSKISGPDDLDRIASLGFRGEALPSIASVAKVTMRTRARDAATQTVICIEGGGPPRLSDEAGPPGTSVEARALFFNTPARRKFLKTPKTDEQRIKQWLQAFSIAHPGVRFRLFADERELLNLPRVENSLTRARGFVRGTVVVVKGNGPGLAIEGVIGHPSNARSESSSIIVLVNGRLVSDKMLLRAVRDGFDSTLKEREFPIGVVKLTVAAGDVDVNVHPQKSEVRFRKGNDVFTFVRDAVRRAVHEFRGPVELRQGTAGAPPISGIPVELPLTAPASRSPVPFSTDYGAGTADDSYRSSAAERPFRFSDLSFVGQLLGCYLVAELDDRCYVVDMHAAHERYNFNLIRNGFRRREVPSQQLLVPVTVTLDGRRVTACLGAAALFEQFGFEIEEFGEGILAVRSVPSILSGADIAELVREVAELAEDGVPDGVFERRIDQIAARIACHASIRSGKHLAADEVRALFAALDSTEFSTACPHGRPILVSFSREEVERWFGRDR